MIIKTTTNSCPPLPPLPSPPSDDDDDDVVIDCPTFLLYMLYSLLS